MLGTSLRDSDESFSMNMKMFSFKSNFLPPPDLKELEHIVILMNVEIHVYKGTKYLLAQVPKCRCIFWNIKEKQVSFMTPSSDLTSEIEDAIDKYTLKAVPLTKKSESYSYNEKKMTPSRKPKPAKANIELEKIATFCLDVEIRVHRIFDIICNKQPLEKFRVIAKAIRTFPGDIRDFSVPYCNTCRRFLERSEENIVCHSCKQMQRFSSLSFKFNFQIWLHDSSDSHIAVCVLGKEATLLFNGLKATDFYQDQEAVDKLETYMNFVLSDKLYLECCIAKYMKGDQTKYRLFGTQLKDLPTLRKLG